MSEELKNIITSWMNPLPDLLAAAEVGVGALDDDDVRSPVPVYVTLTPFPVQAINASGRFEPPVTSNDNVVWPLGASFLLSHQRTHNTINNDILT